MNPKDMKTYRLIIKGKVQGVGFRYWFSNLETSHKLNGYIKNLKKSDKVEAIIQGDTKDILKIIKKSKVGPKFAVVDEVLINEISNNIQYEEFIIKYEN